MTKTNAATSQQGPKPAVIVFGRDKEKRPIAAQFPEKLSILAIKAAAQLQLATIKVTSPPIEAIARQLPMGRIHANGQGVVPVVKDQLFEQVTIIAKGSTPTPVTTSFTGPKAAVPKNEAGKEGNCAGAKGLPANWKDIAVGNLVLAQESLAEGFWYCTVVKRDKDMLTLRWRDYKYPAFLCHVDAVALLNPSPGFDH